MKPLLLLATLAAVVAAIWLYARGQSGAETSPDPIAPIAKPVDAPRAAEESALVRPDEPVARAETEVAPSAPVVQAPPVAAAPVAPPAIVPDELELLEIEGARLRDQLSELTTPILQSKFKNGEGKYLGAQQSYTLTDGQRCDLQHLLSGERRRLSRRDHARGAP